jgi:succinylglutamic semialdehyde dehydrogenase
VSALAASEGAEALVAGGPCEGPRRGHYVRPSLHRVRAHAPASAYQRDEHFLPDAWLLPVDDLDEGLALLDATDYGLVASVFTRDRGVYERAARTLRVGALNWNAATVGASSKLPFGGVKQSGNERAAGAASTLYCTFPQANLEHAVAPAPAGWPGFPVLP